MGCRGGGTGRLVFTDVVVPRENVVGRVHHAAEVFNTMMVPERLGTAAMTIGAARPAVELATAYTRKRKAFGQTVNRFQGVSFQVAEAVTLLDASRSLVYTTARAVDAGLPALATRRWVSKRGSGSRWPEGSASRSVPSAVGSLSKSGTVQRFPKANHPALPYPGGKVVGSGVLPSQRGEEAGEPFTLESLRLDATIHAVLLTSSSRMPPRLFHRSPPRSPLNRRAVTRSVQTGD